MAYAIKVVNTSKEKNIPLNSDITFTLALGVFDENNKPMNVIWKQTETMTAALVGITEYGAFYFNPAISKGAAEIVLTAIILDTGEEVSVTTTASQMKNKGAGNALN